MPAEPDPSPSPLRLLALIAGPILAILLYTLLPAGTYDDQGNLTSGLSHSARACAGAAALMALWWLTQPIPISATALLPIALFPLLDIAPIDAVTSNYGDEIIFLFLGGFILGLAMERWGLQNRLALFTVSIVGTHPAALVAGIMLITAAISMFVSNTATCITMVPIAMSLVTLARESASEAQVRALSLALLLGVAYASSIGGMGTLIGSPPNGILAAHVRAHSESELSFVSWMIVGVPVILAFLPLAWFMLTRPLARTGLSALKGGRAAIRAQLRALGPPSRGERTVIAVFAVTVALWLTRPLLAAQAQNWGIPPLARLSDAGIAIVAALALFLIPVDRTTYAMNWQTCTRIPWGILILFGGGLALADAITTTGLDRAIGSLFHDFAGAPPWVITLAIVSVVMVLSELCSNTALAAAMLPVVWSASREMGVPPAPLLVAATLCSSAAFMLPVGTPPNAIVYSTGLVTQRQMTRNGFILNIAGIIIITVAAHLLAPIAFPDALVR